MHGGTISDSRDQSREIGCSLQLGALSLAAALLAAAGAAHQFKRALTIESLYQAACLNARTAVDLCDRRRA
jgi:hypothetical protein